MSGGFTPLREDRVLGKPVSHGVWPSFLPGPRQQLGDELAVQSMQGSPQPGRPGWPRGSTHQGSHLQTSPRESPERSSKPRALLLTFKLTLNFSINVVNSCKGIISGML